MILSTHLFCLLNLSTTPQLCPLLFLAYTFDVLDLIRQHNQPKYYSLFTMCDLLCTIYYALYIMHYALCTMYYSLCTMYYSLCTMHYVLCIIYYALFIYTYSYVFTILYVFICIYYFIRIHTYLLFHMEIWRNPVILVHTHSSRRVE